MEWLKQSIAATGGQGSAHSWSPLWGWAKAYPETTGYLIETLVQYANVLQDTSLHDLALRCARWLLSCQLPNGAFPALLADSQKPSPFNTAMVLSMVPALPDLWTPADHACLRRAVGYLLQNLSPEGAWMRDAYVPGFMPSYYTYAAWRVLQAQPLLQVPEVPEAMHRAMRYYAARFLPNGTVGQWGFRPGAAAFTHTMAYTWQGFLEAGLLLQEPEWVEKTRLGADHLWKEVQHRGRTAGRYGQDGRGDFSFQCVPGQAQLSVLYHRLAALSGEAQYQQAADFFLLEILEAQDFGKKPGRHGGLPGSVPLWGPYLRLRYPNWAAKFFLDALIPYAPSVVVPV